MLQIENRFRPITAETIDKLGQALISAQAQHRRAIAMAERAA